MNLTLTLSIPDDKAELITKYYSDERGEIDQILIKLVENHISRYLAEPENKTLENAITSQIKQEQFLIEQAKKAELIEVLELVKLEQKDYLKVTKELIIKDKVEPEIDPIKDEKAV